MRTPPLLACLLVSFGVASAQVQQKDRPKPTPQIQKLFEAAQKLPFKERLAAVEKALPAAVAKMDFAGEALLNLACGYYASHTGLPTKALTCYLKALDLYQKLKDRTGEAVTLSNIGLVYSDLGQKAKALEYYERALPIEREVGDRSGEAATLNNIGRVYSDLARIIHARFKRATPCVFNV